VGLYANPEIRGPFSSQLLAASVFQRLNTKSVTAFELHFNQSDISVDSDLHVYIRRTHRVPSVTDFKLDSSQTGSSVLNSGTQTASSYPYIKYTSSTWNDLTEKQLTKLVVLIYALRYNVIIYLKIFSRLY